MTTALRAALPADCEDVYAWNCAPEVRAISGDPRPIALADHVQWFQRRVQHGQIWIVEDAGTAAGVVRIDPHGDTARISIALAPRARGRGLGRRAIALACAAYAAPVDAVIRIDNSASRAAFESTGFALISVTASFATYRWRP